MDVIQLTSPILLNQMIKFVSDANNPSYQGYLLACSFFLLSFLYAYMMNTFWHLTLRIGVHVKKIQYFPN
jgi:hypothetical protein